MEYGTFKIPRPDAVFYLNVPLSLVLKLIKNRKNGKDRKYLGNKKDVYEKDVKFLANSRKSALWLAKTQKGWIKIDCEEHGRIDPRESIHQRILIQPFCVLA